MGMYKKIRYLGSDVHIYEFNQRKEEPRIEFGVVGKLERLSRIGNPKFDEVIKAKMNFGFFTFTATSENLGTFSDGWTTVAYGKDMVMRFYDGEMITKDDIQRIRQDSLWVAGASYTLMENGRVSIRNTPKFPHYAERHPRSIIGQRLNLNIMLIVVQGRRAFNRGMNSSEQARLCRDLGLFNVVNLDGGGSSELIVNIDGVMRIVNRPTDGQERALGSAVVVYRKKEG